MERGLGYVATGSTDTAATLLRTSPWGRSLWITERAWTPPAGDVLRVTTIPRVGGTVDPKRLGDLRAAAAAFLGKDGGGLVVLDCLEYLVLHNGPDRVARALADIHDEISTRGGTLVVLIDPRSANPRLAAWLAREFDPLSVSAADLGPARAGGALTA